MGSRFNIKNATAMWIYCILKTTFEFLFTQRTQTYKQSRNEFDSSMFLTIKNTMGGWRDKFWDIDFKSFKTYDFWNVMVKTVPLVSS